eukprot:g5937.t1
MGNSPSLFDACSQGNLEMLEAALSGLANSGDSIDQNDCEGRTPLLVAAGAKGVNQKNRLKICLDLIARGANPKHTDYRGFTVLHHACTTGDMKLIDALLSQKGVEPTIDRFALSPADVLPASSKVDPRLQVLKQKYSVRVSISKKGNDATSVPDRIITNSDVSETEIYELQAKFDAPKDHKEDEYLQVYYVNRNEPSWKLTKRLGSFSYLPKGPTGSVNFTLPADWNYSYRVIIHKGDGAAVASSEPLMLSSASAEMSKLHEDENKAQNGKNHQANKSIEKCDNAKEVLKSPKIRQGGQKRYRPNTLL